MSFTFTQPVIDHAEQPAPAASILSAVNYDRSPSLVDTSGAPDTPISPHEFTSFAEAQAAYDAFLPGCNWARTPTLKRFWYESEKHLTPNVDYISWSFREHSLWVAASNGEILERNEANEEVASSGPVVLRPEAVAALERSKKIEEEPPKSYAEAFDRAEARAMGITRQEAEKQTAELAAQIFDAKPEGKLNPGDEVIVNDPGLAMLRKACPGMPPNHHGRISSIDGDTCMVVFPIGGSYEQSQVAPYPLAMIEKLTQPGEGTVSTSPTEQPTEPAAAQAVPAIRLKYTDEEYADLRRRAEEDYAIELQRKENLYAEISMERAKQEDKVKALKAEEKGQLESLRFLKSEGPKYPKNPEVKEVANAATNQEGGSAVAAGPGGTAAPQTSEHDVDDERYQRYRELPLLPIVKDIKGLGSTKLSTLVDQYGSVGALLDMMKEKGLQWYKAVGKGFGPELGTRIEDAVADALQKVE